MVVLKANDAFNFEVWALGGRPRRLFSVCKPTEGPPITLLFMVGFFIGRIGVEVCCGGMKWLDEAKQKSILSC